MQLYWVWFTVFIRRNIVHLQKIILRCVGFCFCILHLLCCRQDFSRYLKPQQKHQISWVLQCCGWKSWTTVPKAQGKGSFPCFSYYGLLTADHCFKAINKPVIDNNRYLKVKCRLSIVIRLFFLSLKHFD